MIDLYTWSTPNGEKVQIMLEETGLEYRLNAVNLQEGEQFEPDFLAISPSGKIPAIIDQDGPGGESIPIFESGGILLYLADKSGSFLPADPQLRWQAISWLMFQMGGVGPMRGQAGYFLNKAPEPVPVAVERYTREATASWDAARSSRNELMDSSDPTLSCNRIERTSSWLISFTCSSVTRSSFTTLESRSRGHLFHCVSD